MRSIAMFGIAAIMLIQFFPIDPLFNDSGWWYYFNLIGAIGALFIWWIGRKEPSNPN
jgi:hypothetical protein